MREALDNSGSGGKGGRRMPMSTAELGALIPGYDFLEYVDSGGMGDVYKAVQKSLGRTVAVKLLTHLHQEREEFVERFKREAQALALLNHPNIIAVYDSGQTADGQLYYVMEFVSGMDLHHLLRREPPEARQIMEIITQVCEALHYAHERGIVHRDIKPANILIDERGRVKVADFGLAKITGPQTVDHTATGTTLGTPDYIAPEAMETGVKIDHRVDIYSLGVMIYELFTGHLPKGQWEPPSLRTGADKRVDTLVSRAMQNDPDKRYQSISEMTQLVAKLTKSSPKWKHYRRPASRISTQQKASSSLVSEDAETLLRLPERPATTRGMSRRQMAAVACLLGASSAVWIWRLAARQREGAMGGSKAETMAAGNPQANAPGHTPKPRGQVPTPAQEKLLRWAYARNAFVNVILQNNGVKKKGDGADIDRLEALPKEPFTIWRLCFSRTDSTVSDEQTLAELVKLVNEVGTISNLAVPRLNVPLPALRYFSQIKGLNNLDVSDSLVINEAAVPYLAACKDLKLLRIGGEGRPKDKALAQRLREALPACKVMND